MELISPFAADERHSMRKFQCCWPERRDDGTQIAGRVCDLAVRMQKIVPVAFQLWPEFESRRLRPTDPGPVTSLTAEELGMLLERRSRFDPPRFPAPVSEGGYSVVFGGFAELGGREKLGVFVRSGGPSSWFTGEVIIRVDLDNPIWTDKDAALELLDAMGETFDATWAAAYGFIPDDSSPVRRRPWMIWHAPQPAPSGQDILLRELRAFGPASEVRPHRGGEVSIWP